MDVQQLYGTLQAISRKPSVHDVYH